MRAMKDSGVEWLGEIPAGWELVRAKNYFRLTNERGNRELVLLAATQANGMYPQHQLEGVVRVKGDTDLKTFRTVHKNDYVISLRSFQGGFEMSSYEGVCSPAYQTFHAIRPIDYQYFKRLFKCSGFIDHMNSLTLGIREGRTIKFNDFAVNLIPVPSLNEQHRIAGYLDEKCAEIDRAIEAAEKSIEGYEAYQETLIAATISEGCNPCRQTQSSGIAAIGKINAEWRLVALRRVAVFFNGDRSDEYPSGDDIVSEGIPFVTSADLNGRFLPQTFTKYITEEKYQSLRGVKLRVNDVVFCLRGSVGKCALNSSVHDGTVASSLAVARPLSCDPAWLNYVLMSTTTTDQAVSTAIGATSKNLAANVLKQAYVPLPPLDEQRRIADHLDEKCGQIDRAIAAKQAIIADLKAYKQSLIYEVVTGKREV